VIAGGGCYWHQLNTGRLLGGLVPLALAPLCHTTASRSRAIIPLSPTDRTMLSILRRNAKFTFTQGFLLFVVTMVSILLEKDDPKNPKDPKG